MTYPASFHKLVIMGSLYADTFNTTLSFVPLFSEPIPSPTPALLTAVADKVRLWWDDSLTSAPGTGVGISSAAKLTGIKLNRIGADGKYTDPDTHEHVYPTPISGIAPPQLPQVSLVATLRCPDVRGRAGRGRMYIPPSLATFPDTLGADGRVTTALATNHALGVAQLIRGLNEAYDGAGVNAVAGVASKVGAGRFQIVSSVTVGRVVDTMRSRRNKLDEDPQEVDL